MTRINNIMPRSIDQIAPEKQNEIRKLKSQPEGIEFSKHLMERINRRKLRIGPDETQKLNEAFQKAESKGSRDSLVLLNDLAFIVSVPNRMVVTAMDKNNMNEGVFTNIDSAILM